jgi:hypothetical protein
MGVPGATRAKWVSGSRLLAPQRAEGAGHRMTGSGHDDSGGPHSPTVVALSPVESARNIPSYHALPAYAQHRGKNLLPPSLTVYTQVPCAVCLPGKHMVARWRRGYPARRRWEGDHGADHRGHTGGGTHRTSRTSRERGQGHGVFQDTPITVPGSTSATPFGCRHSWHHYYTAQDRRSSTTPRRAAPPRPRCGCWPYIARVTPRVVISM